jgi:GTP-binding protein
LLVIDAASGVTTGDLAIAGIAWELGRALAVVVNKWDLLDEEKRSALEESWERLSILTASPRRLNASALSGRGLAKLFAMLEETLSDHAFQIGTGELNRLLEEAVRRHHPAVKGKRPWRLYYATQVSSGPPTFMLFANSPLPRQSTYRRYLENFLRQNWMLKGVPIRLVVRQRREE